MNWEFAVGCALAAVLGMSMNSCADSERTNKTERIKALAQQGVDPLDIPCAAGDGTERYCELRAATRKH